MGDGEVAAKSVGGEWGGYAGVAGPYRPIDVVYVGVCRHV